MQNTACKHNKKTGTHIAYKSIISSEANPQGYVFLPLDINNSLHLACVETPSLNNFKTHRTPVKKSGFKTVKSLFCVPR